MMDLVNRGVGGMKRIIAVGVLLAVMPAAVQAQERFGDAALGAFSGGVVLGPVGLVAGAIVGYTAGPSIARTWRENGYYARPRARTVKRQARVASKQRAPVSAPAAGTVTPQSPAPGAGGPPAQGLE